jgi:hypothetical protein
MDEFLKIENQEQKEKRMPKGKQKISGDKKRVARLKKTFLPYWAREMEYESRQENNIDMHT